MLGRIVWHVGVGVSSRAQAQFKLILNTLKVFARKREKSKAPVKRGRRFAFEGTDRR